MTGVVKPCRYCDEPFEIKRSRQYFCSAKCAKDFRSIYKNSDEWFELEWAAWKRDFTEQRHSPQTGGALTS